jgi:hypothetical protein
MLTRLALGLSVALTLVLTTAACGKKTAPKAPASPPAATEAAPTDETTEGEDADPSGGETMQCDPCDGGEAAPDE